MVIVTMPTRPLLPVDSSGQHCYFASIWLVASSALGDVRSKGLVGIKAGTSSVLGGLWAFVPAWPASVESLGLHGPDECCSSGT